MSAAASPSASSVNAAAEKPEYPTPTFNDIRLVIDVIAHAEFKPDYKPVAVDMGFTNANNWFVHFSGII